MSGLEEGEIEEGELTDSDSMEEQQKPPASTEAAPQHYSMFSGPSRSISAAAPRNIPRPCSESEESGGENLSDDEETKKRKFPSKRMDPHPSGGFVNPNYVNNGGKMPPMPKPSSRTIWGSVLQEQILTSEVGSFSMEKKFSSDRNVESYDYTRAKEDDRPFLLEDEVKPSEGELFGEVIDLERVAFKQRRNMKRKHVGERLGRRLHVKERLDRPLHDLPKVTGASSVEDVTYYISRKLRENKVHLIRKVVQVLGQAKSLDLLEETEKTEANGGMMVLNGSRRRMPGGVFLTLLRQDKTISKEQTDTIFEDENRWLDEMKKRKKANARRRKKEKDHDGKEKPWQSRAAAEDKGSKQSSMEVVEDNTSPHSSVKGENGSPKNHDDHLSDSQDGFHQDIKDRSRSDSEEGELDDSQPEEDFANLLACEVKRQAQLSKDRSAAAVDGNGDGDAIAVDEGITVDNVLDDVLDLGVDEDFLDD